MTVRKRKTTKRAESAATQQRPSKRARLSLTEAATTKMPPPPPPPRMTRARLRALKAEDSDNPDIQLNPGLSMKRAARARSGSRTTMSSTTTTATTTTKTPEQPQEESRILLQATQAPAGQQQQLDVVAHGEYEMAAPPPPPSPPVAPVAYMGGLGEDHQPLSVGSSPAFAAAHHCDNNDHHDEEGDKKPHIDYGSPNLSLDTSLGCYYAAVAAGAELPLPVSFPTPPLVDCVRLAGPWAEYRPSSTFHPGSNDDNDDDNDVARRTVREAAPSPSPHSALGGERGGGGMRAALWARSWASFRFPLSPPPDLDSDLVPAAKGRRMTTTSAPYSPSTGVSPKTIVGSAAHSHRPPLSTLQPSFSPPQGSPSSVKVEPVSRKPSQTQSLTGVGARDHRCEVLIRDDEDEDRAVSDGCVEYGEYCPAGGAVPVAAAGGGPSSTKPIPGLGSLDGDDVVGDATRRDGNTTEGMLRGGQQPLQNMIVRGASGELRIVSLQREVIDFPPWPYNALSSAHNDDQFSVELNDEDPLFY